MLNLATVTWFKSYLNTRCKYTLCLLLSRAIYGHVDGSPNEVCFLDSGSGGPEEFASRIDDAQYLYGLRKFVLLHFICIQCSVCVCVCVRWVMFTEVSISDCVMCSHKHVFVSVGY